MKDRAIQLVDHTDNNGELMDVKIQPIRDTNGKIIQGVVVGNTLQQNKALILIAHPNDFKANPTLGVGIGDITLDSDLLDYRHEIREQFYKDGLKITELDLYSVDSVKIEAHYE